MSYELKPCPFCGGKAELIIILGEDPFETPLKWSVRCARSCCKQYPHVSDHDAVEEWNRRVLPQPQCDTQKPMIVEYKGYTGKIIQDSEDGEPYFHGVVIGITDLLVFEGKTLEEAEQSFHDIIDDYFGACDEIGKAPEKSDCLNGMDSRPLQDYIGTLPDPNTLKEKAIKAISDLYDYYEELKRRANGNA